MAAVCGIPAATIREVARLFAKSRGSMILWGMGISQHIHGTDNARCLIALSMMTGQVGRPGTGLHPLRGQNNVQGASDAGLIPMMYPDYRRVDNAEAKQRVRGIVGHGARPEGRTHGRRDHGCGPRRQDSRHVHHGREPGDVGSGRRPRARGAREARDAGRPGHLPHRDRVSRRRDPARVRIPRKDRARSPTPTASFSSGARPSRRRATRGRICEIIVEMAKRLGLDWNYAHPRDVFDEMRAAMPSIAGITWERLEREHAVTYPCEHEGDPGERVVFTAHFPTPSGRGALRPRAGDPRGRAARRTLSVRADHRASARALAHRQHDPPHRSARCDRARTGGVAAIRTTSRRSVWRRRGRSPSTSRRGSIALSARADDGTPRGAVFIPFCYYEAAANLLTNPALDPFGKIPEFKYCAVRVHRRRCRAACAGLRRRARRGAPRSARPQPGARYGRAPEADARTRAKQQRPRLLVGDRGIESVTGGRRYLPLSLRDHQ